MEAAICFFIGTEAELIKLFPVIQGVRQRGLPFRIIASGQNDLNNSQVMLRALGMKPDIELSKESDIRKSAAGLLQWYGKTWRLARRELPAYLTGIDLPRSVMVVHGDTVSTLMGAWLGRRMGMRVAHVEAGLRSHNWLNPFPEEIDRVLTSRKADVHFAPGAEPMKNLAGRTGVVNTEYNTIIDSLAFSRSIPCKDQKVNDLMGRDYFVLVFHRQENLMKKELVRQIAARAKALAAQRCCVFILHKPTEVALQEMGLLQDLLETPNLVALPRVEYFDFMKLLDAAQFVITDGGSNQEELSYMGKPCIILRTHTERQDGLGENALLYGGDLAKLDDFVAHYEEYRRPAVIPERSPSGIISEKLARMLTEQA